MFNLTKLQWIALAWYAIALTVNVYLMYIWTWYLVVSIVLYALGAYLTYKTIGFRAYWTLVTSGFVALGQIKGA